MTSIPASMTAIGITSPGGPEMLAPQERQVPQPGEGEMPTVAAAMPCRGKGSGASLIQRSALTS